MIRPPLAKNKVRVRRLPEPGNMVVFDPDHPLYEQRHVCVLLRKVANALHGHVEEEGADECGESSQ